MNEPVLLAISFPRRALRAAIFLIAIECLMLGIPSRDWPVTSALCLWATSRWWTIRQGWCLTMPLHLNSVFLAALFVIKYTYAPAHFPTDAPFVNTELAHEIGGWLVSLQILILHESSSLKRIPVSFAALGCLVVLCAGDVRLHSVSRSMMLVLMILFVGGLGWFAHTGRNWIQVDQNRRLRRVLMFVTLVLAAVPTVYAAQAWHQHERDLEVLLIRAMRLLEGRPQQYRFRTHSALAQVSSGKIFEPEKPVLRVTYPGEEPLYLRGVILDIYRTNATWITQANSIHLLPREAPSNRGLPTTDPLFPILESHARQWTSTSITYLSKEDPIPLALLDTAEMKIGVPQLQLDPLGNVRLVDDFLPDHLTLYTPIEPEADEPPESDSPARQFPDKLNTRILEMAQSLCAGKTSDAEKIHAVETYFRENYKYQIGLAIPGNEDPVTYFLLTQPRPAAHCEYFASGAAILLRAVGVPTRYVTGYVPSERHSEGYWIARRKDAHAWVEAYDSGLGRWVTVEATPSEGLPERRNATWRDEIAETWRVWTLYVRELLAMYGTWATISVALQSPLARILLGFMLLAAWWGLSRRYRRQQAARTPSASTRVFPFQQWLREVESDLSKRGFERLPQETLLHFSDRILASPDGPQLRLAAEWYAAYSAIRYNESEQTAERVAELKHSWQGLAASTNRR